MEKAINVAHYFCEEYRKISGEAIDEMKLHKLLYFAQRESIAITGKELFNETFEGWKYGPVCVSVREKFHKGEILEKVDKLSGYAVEIARNILLQYGEFESWKLSKISHKEISWRNARKGLADNENGNVPLKLSDIEADAQKVRPYDSVWDMFLDEFDDDEDLE